MTVGTKLHKTLASLRSEAGSLETFALETQDQQAKQMYHQCSQQLSQMVSQLEARVNYVEQQEPTFKISQQTQQQQQGSGMNMGMNNTTTGQNKMR